MELTPERRPRQQSPNENSITRRSPRLAHNSRLKKPPPVTPRRFNKFFAPRLQATQQAAKSSRKALDDLSDAALNIRHASTNARNKDRACVFSPAKKRRKLSFTSVISSPTLPSSPLRHLGLPSSQESGRAEKLGYILSEDESDTEATTEEEDNGMGGGAGPQRRIMSFRANGLSASMLSTRLSGRCPRQVLYNNDTWQHETANFCSVDTDINVPPDTDALTLPFCTAACNTNPVVAIGDEDGYVRLVDSANSAQQDFSKTFLSFKLHDNAVMDLCFSEDDALLVSGSGDQTCHVVDVQKQASLAHLQGHLSSIKKIAFQPGSKSILATCARDGNINIWDLRSRPRSDPNLHSRLPRDLGLDATSSGHLSPVSTISGANGFGAKNKRRAAGTEAGSFRYENSVTSLAFLGSTTPNLFVSTSEADSIVRLWDLRTQYGRKKPSPISVTKEPDGHAHRRPYGITSLVTSTDSSRIYALSRDNSIYVYSTSHLILGNAPELSISLTKPFRPSSSAQSGLGPLYAFSHPQLSVATFYPRLAIRKATDYNPELLASGSSEDCVVLFPTNERYLTKTARNPPSNHFPHHLRPLMSRGPLSDNALPVYYHGTPLLNGHRKEVTAVAWSSEGNLITTSDDFSTRCWRVSPGLVRRIRTNGDIGGYQKYRSGWACVHSEYDEDE